MRSAPRKRTNGCHPPQEPTARPPSRLHSRSHPLLCTGTPALVPHDSFAPGYRRSLSKAIRPHAPVGAPSSRQAPQARGSDHSPKAREASRTSRPLGDRAITPHAWLVRTLAFHIRSRILHLGQCSPDNRAPKVIGENACNLAHAYASLSCPPDPEPGETVNGESKDGASASSTNAGCTRGTITAAPTGTRQLIARMSLAPAHYGVLQPWHEGRLTCTL